MTLAKRVEDVEQNLTPREAMTYWMREAHAFGSHESYARWLVDQPDQAYPLIRMPQQTKGAVRARNSGTPSIKLHGEFRRAERDVLFLYYLHSQANMRALLDHEAIQLRVIILLKEMRALIDARHALDQMRLNRVDLEGDDHTPPDEVEQRMTAIYQEHLTSWRPQANHTYARIAAFLAAAGIISRSFFSGEDILFPDTRENLAGNLQTIANLDETYEDYLLGTSYDSDDDFRDYVLAMETDGLQVALEGFVRLDTDEERPHVSCDARGLAEQWVLMARSQSLDALGDHKEAESLAARIAKEYLG